MPTVLTPNQLDALCHLQSLARIRRETRMMTGAEIRLARCRVHFTLFQLSRVIRDAKGIFCSEPTISNIERGAYLTRKMRRWVQAATEYFKDQGWDFDGRGACIFIPR